MSSTPSPTSPPHRGASGSGFALDRVEDAHARLRSVAEASLDHVIVLDPSLRVLSVNRTQPGTLPESMVGALLPELAEPEEREGVAAVLDEVLRTGRAVRYETRHRRQDLSWAYFDCVASRAEADGRVVGLTVVARDVTDQKEEAAELRRSRERYRLLVETVPHGIEELSVEGTIRFANRSHHRMLGYGDGELIGQSLALIAPTEQDWERLRAHLRDLAREQSPPTPWFGRARTKSGQVLDIQVDWAYRRDAQGAVEGFVSVVTDLTARRKAEEEARRSAARYRLLHESLRDAFVQVSMDGRIVECNDLYCQLLGYTRGEVHQLTYQALTPERWHAFEDAVVREQILPRGYSDVYEKEYRRKDGTVIPVELRTILARDAEGQPSAMWAIVRDISERKRAEGELRQARDHLELRVRERTAQLVKAMGELERDIQRRERAEAEKERLEAQLRHSRALEAVGRLAGGVAHDFNNLLGAVLACAWEAGRPDADAGHLPRELERIQDLCKQGGEVTRQLLAVARQSHPRTVSLDVGRELERIRLLVERACPKTVAVAFELADDLPRVRGDRTLLTTALLNLCLNARDAMPRGGTLALEARSEQRDGTAWALIRVRDTGEGIPRELQDKVFQPFFSTKIRGRGVGLGLPMALATAESMGGTLVFESEPGRGSVFTLRLPPEPESDGDPAGRTGSTEGAEGPWAGRGAVLVVEDEEDIARMVTEVLAARGCRTLRARTGLEALETVQERADEIRLVLLDLMLPELSGATVHQVLKGTVPDIPVVFVTGREDLAAQADASVPVLRKPFTEDALIESVRALFPCPEAESRGGGRGP